MPYISVWLPEFTIEDGQAHFLTVLNLFPLSERAHKFSFEVRKGEGALLLEACAAGIPTVREVSDRVAEHFDSETEIRVWAHWDIYEPCKKQIEYGAEVTVWERWPNSVLLQLRGEGFASGEYRQRGHITVDVGDQERFVATITTEDDPEAMEHILQNAIMLQDFVTEFKACHPLCRYQLWSDTDFTVTVERLFGPL